MRGRCSPTNLTPIGNGCTGMWLVRQCNGWSGSAQRGKRFVDDRAKSRQVPSSRSWLRGHPGLEQQLCNVTKAELKPKTPARLTTDDGCPKTVTAVARF